MSQRLSGDAKAQANIDELREKVCRHEPVQIEGKPWESRLVIEWDDGYRFHSSKILVCKLCRCLYAEEIPEERPEFP